MTYINHIEPLEYIVGQIANSNPYSLLTEVNQEIVKIPYGIAVKLDPTAGGWKLPAASTDITATQLFVTTIGTRVTPYTYDTNGNLVVTQNDGIPAARDGAAMSFGYISVTVEEAVNDGDPVFIRFLANGANTQLGSFRKSADPNATPAPTAAQYAQWIYASSALAGGIALVCVK
jgi:hypothetical protein